MKAAIIGGDKRMLYAAKAFLDGGFEVALGGFDHLKSLCEIRIGDVRSAVDWADFTVLPIRPVTGDILSSPYSDERITVGELARAVGKKPVFSGRADDLKPYLQGRVYDYASREDFAVRNAVLTAEGAISIAVGAYEDSLCGANVLVTGYGRIGRALSRLLQAYGAYVTVAARKPSDRAWTRVMGMNAIDYSFKELNSYHLIFNTVPAMIFDRERINMLREDAILIDLASLPGGMDFDRAEERGLCCIHALALPGKTAPKAAGRIIKDTIIQIIKEENGGKDHSGLCDDRLLLHL